MQYPSFLLELLVHPRQLLRRLNWQDAGTALSLSFHTLLSLAIICIGFSDTRIMAELAAPPLSSFKGIIMRAHIMSFDWLAVIYEPYDLDQGYAMRMWDVILMPGFVAWTLFSAMLAIAVLARLRMLRSKLDWNQAIGTGLLGMLGMLACQCLALIPLGLLLICRHCGVRLALFIILWLAGWCYLGYYSLADLGERPRGMLPTLWRSLLYGFIQALIGGLVFWLLILPVIPA